MKSKPLILHLGSNVGDRISNLKLAKVLISQKISKVSSQSSYYLTEAWGKKDQEDFVNSALLLYSDRRPADLLRIIKTIENSIGRKEKKKWEPRIIDIDIIIYGDMNFQSKTLNIPHKHMHKRKFVLVPVNELEFDNFVHPLFGMTVSELLENCKDKLKVRKMKSEEI